ncbi:MAG TPA: tetratricopeptide repeat protein [Candidatus Eisenbacteria bacterium]
MNRARRRLLSWIVLLSVTLSASAAWALSSADLIKKGVTALKDGKNQDALAAFTEAERLDPQSPRPHYYIASALERMGSADSARAEYETAIRVNPKYAEALTGLGNLLRKQGKLAEGTERLELAVKYDPKDPAALYSLGQAYLKDKKFDDAEKIFRKGTLLKQARALFLAGTALALEGKGDLKQAEELFIRARETDPNNLRVRLDLGGFYTRKKIPVLAAPEYGKATELDPHNPEVHYLYGKALVGMNEFNAGLREFQSATTEDSTYTPALLEAGRLFARASRPEDAVEKFRRYTDLKPDDYEGFLELGGALAKSRIPGDRQSAIGILEKANDLKPNVAEVLGTLCRLYAEQSATYHDEALATCDKYASMADSLTPEEKLKIGTLYVANQDSAKAVPLLEKAVEEDSTKARDANFQLGFLFFARRDYDGATPFFERVLRADSTFVPAILNLGLCKLQSGKKSEAIEILRRAVALNPKQVQAQIWIGQTLLSMEPDSLPVALESFQRAAQADSASGDAMRGAGLSLLLMDNCADALDWLSRATVTEPDHVQGHIWLAQAYSKCKDQTRAKAEFNKALELDPTNQEASRGLDIIRKWEEQVQQRRSSAASGQ